MRTKRRSRSAYIYNLKLIYNGNKTEWSPILSVIIRVINKIDLLITSVITDRIGRQEVLVPINHNHFNFQKEIYLKQIFTVDTMSWVTNSSILEIPQFFFKQVVVAMVIVINSVIGGFSWVDLV